MSAAPREASSLFAPESEGPWLFGRAADLAIFGGSALASLALVALGALTGVLEADTPEWTWLACVLAVDVAHVWSTAFRVYLDGEELRRRPLLYTAAPALAWGVGVMAYAVSPGTFWTLLAYLAVWHFVRQQYGWVALYRRRAGETSRLDRVLDTLAIYAATLGPIAWWHAHLPRRFAWFLPDDFVPGLPPSLVDALAPAYWGCLALFLARQLWLLAARRRVNAGKVLVVATTWLCWWLGIVALDGDYAFTVTNVLVHGVPYLALTYRYGRARATSRPRSVLGRVLRFGVPAFLGLVVLAAFCEEALWDRLLWQERGWLFGEGSALGDALEAIGHAAGDTALGGGVEDGAGGLLVFLVPLLALPQATHYALDAFVWRVRPENPDLARALTRRAS